MTLIPRCLPARFVALLQDRRGVSAIEFAMLLPLLVTLYFGTVEVSQGLSIDRKVTLTARTVADLVSQASSIDNTGMSNILKASESVILPYPTKDLKVTVSAVTIDDKGQATVTWSDALNTTPRAKGQSVALPSALVVKNTQLIWSEVKYTYTPTVGYVITGTLDLSDQIYMRPRLSDTVTRT